MLHHVFFGLRKNRKLELSEKDDLPDGENVSERKMVLMV
jgi:hypothetical protein